MIHSHFKDAELSALGFGSMRLPVIDGKDEQIDREETARMVGKAFESGINYFDTAWGYHAGYSETVMGECLSGYPRDSFYLADKFPGYDLSNFPKAEEIFEKQLAKCGVEYFDFYLMHNVCELNIEYYLDPKYGILDYFRRQKENGRIKHLGFSAHGRLDCIKRYMEVYGDFMEFCQIQLNWFDWTFQNAKDVVAYLNDREIPIWVMEPVRGGRLLSLDDEDTASLQAMRPGKSLAWWAFRFLTDIPTVKVVLSGMSNEEQLAENIGIFSTEEHLTEEETEKLIGIGQRMGESGTLPCTACHYCTSHCPQGLDIPRILSFYNEALFKGDESDFISAFAANSFDPDKQPAACIHCRSCEAVCPQQIKISDAMSDFEARRKAFFGE